MAVAEEWHITSHVLANPGGFDEVVFNAEKAAAGGADISRGDGGESSSVTVEGGRTVVDFFTDRKIVTERYWAEEG